MSDFLPLYALTRHASWLNSQILSSQSSTRMNSTTRSSSFRLARLAGPVHRRNKKWAEQGRDIRMVMGGGQGTY